MLTLGIFLSLTLYAMNTKTDFSGWIGFVVGATSIFIICGFFLMFTNNPLINVIYSGVGALIFCVYIVIDT